MAVNRDRLRILGALLAAPLLGLASTQASAGATKKKTAKKTTKKKASKKKTATSKKKVAKRPAVRIAEPGTLGVLGAGLVAVGVARKLGSRKKKPD